MLGHFYFKLNQERKKNEKRSENLYESCKKNKSLQPWKQNLQRRHKIMKFEFTKWRERKQQKFDPEKITLKMGNKEFNIYNMIQEAREDTEIVPTLEKYGSIDRLILNKEELYEDFTNMEKQRSLVDQIKYADNMFYTLPLEIRQEFKNNKYEFMKNGKEWVKNKIETEKAEIMKQNEGTQNNVENNSNTITN